MPSQTVDFLYKVDAALAGLYVSLVSNVDGVTKYAAVTTSDVNGKWTINPKPPAGTYALYTGGAQGVLTTLVDPDYVVDPFNDDGTAVFPKQVTISAGGLVAAGFIAATGATGSLRIGTTDGTQGQLAIAGGNTFFDFLGSLSIRTINGGLFNTLATFPTLPNGQIQFATGLTITAGGLTVTGNTAITGTLSVTSNLQGSNLILTGGILQPPVGGFSITNAANSQSNFFMGDSGNVQIRGWLDGVAAGQVVIGPTGGLATSVAIRSPGKSLIIGTTLTALGAGAQTLTAAQLLGGVIEHTVTAAVADTFDTGANLDAAVPNVATGDSFTCILTVLGAFTVTLTAAAGITLRGTAAVVGTAAGKVCVLTMRRTGVNAWTVYAATGA